MEDLTLMKAKVIKDAVSGGCRCLLGILTGNSKMQKLAYWGFECGATSEGFFLALACPVKKASIAV